MLKAKEESIMETISLAIQSCIGLIFAIYGIYILLTNRKKGKQTISKFVLALVCILVGIFLLGYAFYFPTMKTLSKENQ